MMKNLAMRQFVGNLIWKIPNVMKSPDRVEYIFKDIAKFDTQSPIVGDILKQSQKVYLDNLPSIKDIEIRNRLDKLKSDRYYKNDNRPPPPGILPPRAPRPRQPRPPPPPNDDDFFNLPSRPPPSYNFDSRYIPSAPDPPPLSRSNIKHDDDDDDDDDFNVNFPEKILQQLKNFY